MGGVTAKTIDEAAIMAVLARIPDPEIPVLTITDLGIVRGFATDPPRVMISPTYTGCPATVAIEMMIREALDRSGFEEVHIERVLFPPWSRFGSTPCKAQWRCKSCLEPFERFKCH
jgi:ring-1,2-phenylacetyl-CoA epoxidase subunit PaaD